MLPNTSNKAVPLPLKVKFPLLALKNGSAPSPCCIKSPLELILPANLVSVDATVKAALYLQLLLIHLL